MIIDLSLKRAPFSIKSHKYIFSRVRIIRDILFIIEQQSSNSYIKLIKEDRKLTDLERGIIKNVNFISKDINFNAIGWWKNITYDINDFEATHKLKLGFLKDVNGILNKVHDSLEKSKRL